MPAKRKRDILEGYDPNKSDSEDENFDPTEDLPPRKSAKKSRRSKPKGSSQRSQRGRRVDRYGGSDIDDDDDEISESDEVSFNDDSDADEDDEDEDLPIGASGRRKRKAAVKHQSYKEDTDDEEEEKIEDSNDDDEDDLERLPAKPSKTSSQKTRIVTLTVKKGLEAIGSRKTGRSTAAAAAALPASHVSTRRTRGRTEEPEEFLELSNSGRHAQISRDSRSKSPETAAQAKRLTRGGKGLKKPPTTIPEATQETEPKTEEDLLEDEELPRQGQAEDDRPPETDVQPYMEGDIVGDIVGDVDADVDADAAAGGEEEDQGHASPDELAKEPEVVDQAVDADEDEDDAPLTRRRTTRITRAASNSQSAPVEDADDEVNTRGGGRSLRNRPGNKKNLQEPSSDFEPGDDGSASDASHKEVSKGRKAASASSSPTPRGRRATGSQAKSRMATRKSQRNQDSGDEDLELDKDELAEEAEELRQSSRSRPNLRRRRVRSPSIQYEERQSKRRRTAKPVDYTIKAIDPATFEMEEDDEPAAATPARRKGGRGGNTGAWERNFNTTYGPFGGGGGAGSLLGGPWGTGAAGGVDSDSSDDEMGQRSGVGGTVGMTPTSAAPPLGLFGGGQVAKDDGAGIGGATPNVGKIKDRKALADADPLGVDLNVDFSKVGGLQGHIDQLKEMVQLPLLYPELFAKFHVTPPRGVLFHGPPGTGKTLLARALANSVGIGGRKITFYMRKGADALSKWVGEAEKQLRLLFEEARRTQPSIIFFDEIDGLAPVRSSKQEQIHASIVSTLLALMDGMDGRGQVIVIGATNRPDNIDPALRRPGRFDREFYFPLPDKEGRRSILDIHTKDWGLSEQFKDTLAERTKGYGGADLRALCTEAAINSIQRTYPQIYSSKEKLIVDPDKISIHATDFMISIKKLIPSSERSTSAGATPLPKSVEPLLRGQYQTVIDMLNNALPRKKKLTALEEAMYEHPEEADYGFGREAMSQEFERSRVFRPRLLIAGKPGMGQNYLSAAILHHLEGIHVQNFDLGTLMGDGRPMEQVIVSLFTEVKRHKPSVIYIPAIDSWWMSLSDQAHATFLTMLRSIPATDPILLLGTAEADVLNLDQDMLKQLFGFSKKNRAVIERPRRDVRIEYFSNIIAFARKSPNEFPDPADRKKRVLEELPVAPPPPPRVLTKAEIKAQRKADLHSLNVLKTQLLPIMEQIHRKYRKFRQPVIPLGQIQYLFEEQDPNYVRPDVAEGEHRPYELARDKEGTEGLRDTATGKFFYNLDTNTIEERLANGYYARPRDFYSDINKLYNDAKNIGDRERTLKANELRTNVEVDVTDIELRLNNMGIKVEEIYQRQLKRAREEAEKLVKRQAMQNVIDLVGTDLTQENDSDSQGPVGIGLPIENASTTRARFQVKSPTRSNGHGSSSGSHALTNGNSVPSSRHPGEDTEMGGMEDDNQPHSGPFEPMQPPWPARNSRPLGSSTRATAGTQLSQVSAITPLPPGVSPSAIANDASTTKTSDPSTGRDSGPWSTQMSNGLHNSNPEQQSQLLDTQPQYNTPMGHSQGPSQSTSDSQWAHSQAHGLARGILKTPIHQTSPSSSQVPPAYKENVKPAAASVAAIGNILNSEEKSNGSSGHSSLRQSNVSAASSQPQLTIDESGLKLFLSRIADVTSGCTVEQLEQINRELMDVIWKTRNEWNRAKVLSDLKAVFNDTIADIEALQEFEQSSQEKDELDMGEHDGHFVVLK